ncbi:hypothetical protein PENARI_c026G05938 [Penicillium arizonense]|uniref:Uncharacterized protein n=1 Tax=Penicillium arizonense TaxID=1835702 RepID=A0A1F5L6C9_PENAI|nr:hypothetical protein PENARI_c026G05938 [Penicillium arizonense]OGE48784.1 hypothetical protein PENARI_c026G05938 [Penicillium arizonense]
MAKKKSFEMKLKEINENLSRMSADTENARNASESIELATESSSAALDTTPTPAPRRSVATDASTIASTDASTNASTNASKASLATERIIKQAIEDQIEDLNAKNTYTLIIRPRKTQVLPGQWRFSIKKDAHDYATGFKAR